MFRVLFSVYGWGGLVYVCVYLWMCEWMCVCVLLCLCVLVFCIQGEGETQGHERSSRTDRERGGGHPNRITLPFY